MKATFEIEGHLTEIHTAATLCALLDAYNKYPQKPDEMLFEMSKALLWLFILLDDAPEGFPTDNMCVEMWAREGTNTKTLIGLMRKIADRMEEAISDLDPSP